MGRDVPAYRKHSNGQAFVQSKSIDRPGHRLYLGKYGTKESRKRYQDFIDRLALARETETALAMPEVGADLTIAELCRLYWLHAKAYYRNPNGSQSSEINIVARAIDYLTECFPDLPAKQFGPVKLQEVRSRIVKSGVTRITANGYVSRVKRIFQWGCSKEHVPPHIFAGLQSVKGLSKGRTSAPELEEVQPVPLATVLATLPFCSPTIAAMIRLQFWIGGRPQDVTNMRPCDIDTSGPIWLYRPHHHKTAHRGKKLVKAIPPQGQEILRPLLAAAGDPQAYLFVPKATPRAGPKYNTNSYRGAIYTACDRAFEPPPPLGRHPGETVTKWHRRLTEQQWAELEAYRIERRWSPNQLRHAIATYLDEKLGHQAASRWLGHDRLDTTAIYVEKQVSELVAIAAEVARQTELQL